MMHGDSGWQEHGLRVHDRLHHGHEVVYLLEELLREELLRELVRRLRRLDDALLGAELGADLLLLLLQPRLVVLLGLEAALNDDLLDLGENDSERDGEQLLVAGRASHAAAAPALPPPLDLPPASFSAPSSLSALPSTSDSLLPSPLSSSSALPSSTSSSSAGLEGPRG